MTFHESFDAELAELEARRRAIRNRDWLQQSASPEVADRLSRSFALYNADPQVHLAMAEAGVDPERDAETWASITASHQIRSQGAVTGESGPAGLLNPSRLTARYEPISGKLMGFGGVDPAQSDAMMRAIGILTEGGEFTADEMASAVEQGAITADALTQFTAEFKRDAAEQMALSKTPGGGPSLGDVITALPLPILGASESVIDPAADFVERNVLDPAKDNPATDWVQAEILEPMGRFARDNRVTTEVIAPTVNVGVSVLDFGYQMTQAELRQIYTRYKDEGINGFAPDDLSIEGVRRFAEDTAAQHLTAAMQTNVGAMAFDFGEEFNDDVNVVGEGMNIGSGFFFGDQAEEFRRRIEVGNTALIDGQVATLGRWAASPLDAGSREHTILSGLIDASLAVAGPSELAFDSAFDFYKAQRAFRTTEGGLPALRLGDALVGADDTEEITALLRSAGVRTFSDEDVGRVARAQTTEAVQDALARMETPRAPGLTMETVRVPVDFGDTRGGGVQFHGSADEIKDLTQDYYSNRNFYGRGFYTSDDVGIARRYRRRAGQDGFVYQVEEVEPVRFFDLEQTVTPDEFAATIEEGWKGISDEVVDALILGGGGDEMTWREAFDALRRGSAEAGFSRDTVTEIQDSIANTFQMRGYGGFTHRGIQGQGGDAVKIYWEPDDQLSVSRIEVDESVERPVGGSSLDAPPRRPADIDLTAPIPQSARDALHARWGALRGVRPTVDPNAVRHFIDSRRGTRLTERLAEETSTRMIDRILQGQLSGRRLEMYAEATDPGVVRALLGEDLGVHLARRPGRGRMPRAIDAVRDVAPRASRLGGAVPSGVYDLDHSRRLIDTSQEILVNTGASPRTLDYWHARVARAGNRIERSEAIFRMSEEIGLRAVLDGVPDLKPKIKAWAADAGVDEDELWDALRRNERHPTGVDDVDYEIALARGAARNLSTVFRDHLTFGRVYDMDYMTGNLVDTMVHNGDELSVVDRAVVHLHSEAINRTMPIGDPKEMRRYFSNLRPILIAEKGGLKVSDRVHRAVVHATTGTFDFLGNVQSNIWKPAVLLRLAWPVRVIGEEQVRLAAGGYSSAMNHPLHHISVMMGNRRFVSRQLERLGYDIGSPERRALGDFAGDLFGERLALADEHTQAMSSGLGRPRRARAQSYETIETEFAPPEDVNNAWAHEMAKLSNDRVGRVVLSSESLDDAKRIFWEDMESVRSDLATMRPDADVNVMTRAGADEYLDSVADRISRLTNDNPELIEAMRVRGFDDVAMSSGENLNRAFVDHLERYRKDYAPAYLPSRISIGVGELEHRAVDTMFDWLMAKPTDMLSRSPVFRQEYWREVQALAPRIPRSEAGRLVVAARKANLPSSDIRQLSRTVGRQTSDVTGEAVGALSRNAVDTMAKARALDRTQELLFDLSQRNQFFDVMSLIFPFGDAWAEVVTRWAKLAAEDPMVVRRASQAIEGGRESGFIYENERGEEVFNYPGSGWITEQMTGLNVPFTGRLQGLSLATEVLPGIGPVAQLPLAAVVPNTSEWDWLRNVLFPFGEPDVQLDFDGGVPSLDMQNPGSLIIDQFVPPAWRKMWTGLAGEGATPEEQRLFASSFGNVFFGLGSSGEYDVFADDPTVAREELERLRSDAQNGTGKLWLARGLVQFGAPSAPSPDWYLEDETGERVQIAALRELYSQAFEEHPDDPIGFFIDEYGPWALGAMQGRTVASAPGRGLPPTKEAEAWLNDNPDLGEEFTLVYGFFAPQDGEFDYQAYSRILDRGERVPLTEEQQVTRWLHTMGSYEYARERERVEQVALDAGWDGEGLLPIVARRHLAEFDAYLTDKYKSGTGGYGGRQNRWSGPDRASVEEAQAQLRAAIEDERLADHPIAEASRNLFEQMDTLDERWEANHPGEGEAASWHTSTAGTGYREYMLEVADYWVTQTPEFASVFEALFEPVIAQGLEKDEQGEG